ncbi:hypothetical protein BDE02_07G052300 [Populus trichocarpa]|nr:hypothetical protein BDE02_07G052300 [Populus trichocarpa]
MESSSSQLKSVAIFPSQQQQCCLHQHRNSGGRSSFQQKKRHLLLRPSTAIGSTSQRGVALVKFPSPAEHQLLPATTAVSSWVAIHNNCLSLAMVADIPPQH